MSFVLRSAVLVAAIALSVSSLAQTPAAKPAAAKPAAAAAAVALPTGMSEKQRNSYMIGMSLAKSLAQIKDEIDVASLTRAIQDSLAGKPLALTEAQAQQIGAAFNQKMQGKMAAKQAEQGAKNQSAGAAFLAANKTKPGVRTTASGLQYQVLRQGSGPKPAATDTVRVHYKGTLIDGSTFDSSYDRGQPAEFALNQVIPGWSEGVALMTVGSKYKFWIPSNLGYGANAPPQIGPNAMLTFEVELLAIVK
jgi:FKBP-type peptidyl-prolyl cis-trans isomerase